MSGFNASDWALRHRSLLAFAMLTVLVAGGLSFLRLGRSEDPSFAIKTMVVQAGWPGATLDDTLSQVTDRLERTLQEVPGLDYVRSYTTAGKATIFVNVAGSIPARELPDLWYQVRKKVGDMRASLPQGVVGPGFNDEFGDTYGIIYGFTADGFSQRELRDQVDAVRSRLLQVPGIAKVDLLGAQDERIYVEFSTARLAGFGLDRRQIVAALQAQNLVTPAGTVQTAEEKILLQVSGSLRTEADLARVNFVVNGRTIRLLDIATVRRGTVDPAQPMFRVNGQPALGLAMSMQAGGDVLRLGKDVAHAMAEITADLPIGITPQLVADQSVTVSHAIDEFMEALWEAVAIVLAVSFLSLGLRAGAVVALAIPLVLAITFLAMEYAGIDLQRISLGALIIALGLLVDDAMITVESMMGRLEAGDGLREAATFAYTSTAFPMLSGTLVTVAGFVPIGFARSAAGEYTFSLFAVVAIALVASWFVAILFAPLLGVAILRAPKRPQEHGPGRILRAFRAVLLRAMRRRWLTLGVTLALFVAALAGTRLVPHQFFPASDRPELLVDIRLPQNAAIAATEEAATRFDALLKDDPDVEHWSTYVGRGAVRFYLPLNAQLSNDFLAQAVVVTHDLAARERVRMRLKATLPEDFPNAVTRVYPLEQGPPVGWPVQYRISGPDPLKVREIALAVASAVGSDPRARTVNFDWMETARVLRVAVDQDQARQLGLSSADVAQALNATLSGITVTQLRDGIYLVDVLARAEEADRTSLATLRTLELPLAGGRTVPLSQVASLGYGQEIPQLWRRDRVPTLTVQADVVDGALPATVVEALAPRIAAIAAELPAGYRLAAGGTLEESGKSQRSVLAVVPLMLFLTLGILMVQLQSFQRLFLVLSVAPLGLIGVVAALLLADKPLGFVAILGVLALIGMIARNSVILIDQIEHEVAHGRRRWDAVLEATSHRFRPIMLTAAAAILGMIPIAPTVFWGPMAYAIMGGLAGATLLTLLALPALYVAWFRVREDEEVPVLVGEAAPAAPTASAEASVGAIARPSR